MSPTKRTTDEPQAEAEGTSAPEGPATESKRAEGSAEPSAPASGPAATAAASRTPPPPKAKRDDPLRRAALPEAPGTEDPEVVRALVDLCSSDPGAPVRVVSRVKTVLHGTGKVDRGQELVVPARIALNLGAGFLYLGTKPETDTEREERAVREAGAPDAEAKRAAKRAAKERARAQG